jgi:two-component system, LytTR family, response regulator
MNLLIVDDEPAARAELIELCARNHDLRVIGEASSGGEGIEAVEALRPDLLLLDAELPDMTGFDVLRALSAGNQRRTILVTRNAESAGTAFTAGALDYLLKPVSAEAFSLSILRASARLKSRHARPRWVQRRRGSVPSRVDPDQHKPFLLVGEREHRLFPLDPQKIDYIESAGNYVKYRIGNSEYIAREAIKRLDAVLCPMGFIRIERSLLLNVRAVAYAQPTGRGTFTFTLISGRHLHSGPAYREIILDALPLRRRASTRGEKKSHPEFDVSAPGDGATRKAVRKLPES